MGSGQGEAGGTVIERGPLPLGGGVTCGAILAEAGRAVVRVGCLVEIRQMARGTGIGSAGVKASNVALFARCGSVGSGQGEPRRTMIECGTLPLDCCVTHGAVLGKPEVAWFGLVVLL